jgi:NAD(P)H-hydrate epimerase
MSDPIRSPDQVRRFDRIAVDQFGLHGLVLMENAGRGCADHLMAQGIQHGAAIICGPGNNGGDGFVLARHLHLRGVPVRVAVLAEPTRLTADARANLNILEKTRVPIAWLDEPIVSQLAEWLAAAAAAGCDWIVDGLLGTGARTPLGPPLDQVVRQINSYRGQRMAIDIPTGLDAGGGSTQSAGDAVVHADLTCTMVALKPGMVTPLGRRWCGAVRIVDIGAPPEVWERL